MTKSGIRSLAAVLLLTLWAGPVAQSSSAEPAPDDLALSAEQLRGSCDRSLLPGLKRSQNAITLREYDVIGRLAKDRRIKSIVYLNRFGEVRWAKQPELWTLTFAEFNRRAPLPTDAVSRAETSKTPIVADAGKRNWEVALPLVSGDQVQGVLDIQTDAAGLRSLGADARKTLKKDAPIRPAAARTAPAKSPASERQAQQYYLSGLIYFHKGDLARARGEWTHAQTLDPGNPEIPQALKRVKAK